MVAPHVYHRDYVQMGAVTGYNTGAMAEDTMENTGGDERDNQIRSILDRVDFYTRELEYLRASKRYMEAAQLETDMWTALTEAVRLEMQRPVTDDRNPGYTALVTHMVTKPDPVLESDYVHVTLSDGDVIELPPEKIPEGARVGNLVVDVSWSERYLTPMTGEGIKYHDLRIAEPPEVGQLVLDVAGYYWDHGIRDEE